MQNPHVREELRRIMGYWLQLGVAGFRVDALPFVLEKPSLDGGRPGTDFDLLHQIRDMVQWRRGDAVLLAEANVPPDRTASTSPDGDGVHMMFNFWANQHLFSALATQDARPLAQALRETRIARRGAVGQLPAQPRRARPRTSRRGRPPSGVRRVRPRTSMQLYDRGIRRRLAPMLGDRRKIELAYSLLFSLPGTPVLRYGDEIGMGDNLRLRERMAIRTPMQWSAGHQAGFSSAERTVLPVIQRGLYSADNVNVEQQWRDPSSLLRWTSRLIRARKACPEIGWGSWNIIPTRPPNVLAIEYVWRGTSLVCLHNLAAHPVEVSLSPTTDERVPRQRADPGGQHGWRRRRAPHRSRCLRLSLVPGRAGARGPASGCMITPPTERFGWFVKRSGRVGWRGEPSVVLAPGAAGGDADALAVGRAA